MPDSTVNQTNSHRKFRNRASPAGAEEDDVVEARVRQSRLAGAGEVLQPTAPPARNAMMFTAPSAALVESHRSRCLKIATEELWVHVSVKTSMTSSVTT